MWLHFLFTLHISPMRAWFYSRVLPVEGNVSLAPPQARCFSQAAQEPISSHEDRDIVRCSECSGIHLRGEVLSLDPLQFVVLMQIPLGARLCTGTQPVRVWACYVRLKREYFKVVAKTQTHMRRHCDPQNQFAGGNLAWISSTWSAISAHLLITGWPISELNSQLR